MALKQLFNGLDYWRLADEVSVIDATFLTIGIEPGHYSLVNPDNPLSSNIRKEAGYTDEDDTYQNRDGYVWISPANFRAVFKALRNAILSNKLQAKIVNRGRKPDYQSGYDNSYYRVPLDGEEDELHYELTVSRAASTVYSNSDSILSSDARPEDGVIYILKEPDWEQTTIEIDDLKRWFSARGVAPQFFFPQGVADGFRDRSHPRYSAKLATAVAAWEAVKAPAKNKSPKQTLTDWIIGNGVRFELSNEDGVVSPSVAEEVAKVANWKTGGGANPTNPDLEEPSTVDEVDVQNFERVSPSSSKNRRKTGDDDGGIPF